MARMNSDEQQIERQWQDQLSDEHEADAMSVVDEAFNEWQDLKRKDEIEMLAFQKEWFLEQASQFKTREDLLNFCLDILFDTDPQCEPIKNYKD